ncbi:MAG: DsrE/DsrF/DrsH-like family protein [Eubacteriales bacterium]
MNAQSVESTINQLAEEKPKKATLVVLSGDMDKVMAAFIIATGAAASGIDVTMFFTFWGLKAIKKNVGTGKTLFGKMLGLFYSGGDIAKLNPSRLSFCGMGRWMFNKMMGNHNVPSLPSLRDMALDLDIKMIACQMSMDVMEIPAEALIDGVTIGGVATFVGDASESNFTLFI